MAHGDVSFTFVSRIDEIEENLNAGHLQSALALALTLPDICGGIAFPEYTKKYRDGKVMKDRNGEPTRDIGRQYIQWIDTYAAPFLKKIRKTQRRIFPESDAGSCAANICIKTRDLIMKTCLCLYISIWE